MGATARWPATLRLRAWERTQLRLVEGERLLDVGCGLGEAAFALAHDLGETGEVVGVDVSAEMLRVARANADAVKCRVRFSVGDACALDEPSSSFDAVRSERTLQWIAEPLVAVGEMARVLHPGGRVSLIDTDWSSLTIDIGDNDDAALAEVRALASKFPAECSQVETQGHERRAEPAIEHRKPASRASPNDRLHAARQDVTDTHLDRMEPR